MHISDLCSMQHADLIVFKAFKTLHYEGVFEKMRFRLFGSDTIFNNSFFLLFLSFRRRPRLRVCTDWSDDYPCFSFGCSCSLHNVSKTPDERPPKCLDGLCHVDITALGQFCAITGFARVPVLM